MVTLGTALVCVLVSLQDILADTADLLCNLAALLALVGGVLMDFNAIIGKVIALLTS